MVVLYWLPPSLSFLFERLDWIGNVPARAPVHSKNAPTWSAREKTIFKCLLYEDLPIIPSFPNNVSTLPEN